MARPLVSSGLRLGDRQELEYPQDGSGEPSYLRYPSRKCFARPARTHTSCKAFSPGVIPDPKKPRFFDAPRENSLHTRTESMITIPLNLLENAPKLDGLQIRLTGKPIPAGRLNVNGIGIDAYNSRITPVCCSK